MAQLEWIMPLQFAHINNKKNLKSKRYQYFYALFKKSDFSKKYIFLLKKFQASNEIFVSIFFIFATT